MTNKIIILLIILYVYFIQFHKRVYKKEFLEDLISEFKTGDIICFKAYNNFNSIPLFSYFGHVGVVYVDDETKTPYIFEANGIENMDLKSHHNKNGIFLTPLRERVEKYKGRAFYKKLHTPLDDNLNYYFKQFINYGLENMSYDKNLFNSWINNITGARYCDRKTNCGELAFLSLIKLELLDFDKYYEKPEFHHLYQVTKLKDVNNNKYHELIEIVDYPFAY